MLHMEQKDYKKDYKFEIISELLREENHARAIAKKLDVNHMSIVRKFKELLEENVVDYKQKGKNKVYFLRKSIEAKTYVFKTEHYKLIKILREYPLLGSVFEKVQKNKKIKFAVLFGSYAKGTAGKTSDIDVYVETDDRNLKKELELINIRLSVKIGKFDLSSLLVKEIIKDHIIIKGVEKFYEKIGFFE